HEVERHTTYLELEYKVDTRNADALRAAEQLDSISDQSFSAFDGALASRPDSAVSHMEQARPALRRYRFVVDNARRLAGHQLTPDGARAVAALGLAAAGAGGQLLLTTLRGTNFGFVQTLRPITALLLSRRGQILHPDPETAISFGLLVVAFALRALILSRNLPTYPITVSEDRLGEEFARMLLGYLSSRG